MEMPGVEPGSEVENPKHATCVFDLQVLVAWGTDRQVPHDQYQCFLTLCPGTQLRASLFQASPRVESNRRLSS